MPTSVKVPAMALPAMSASTRLAQSEVRIRILDGGGWKNEWEGRQRRIAMRRQRPLCDGCLALESVREDRVVVVDADNVGLNRGRPGAPAAEHRRVAGNAAESAA